MEAGAVIAALGLGPHPEGGWYRQTWVAPGAGRPGATCIHYLLRRGERSHWHRVDADELWIFNLGAPLLLRIAADAGGPARCHRLGPDLAGGQVLQQLVPAGHWQAAAGAGDWSLVSCLVSPGFRFEGFELAAPGFDIPAEISDA